MYSNKTRLAPALILFLLTTVALHGQVMDPWTGKQVNLAFGKTTTRDGIFEGFSAQYGIYAHKATTDSYTALPYIFIPSESNKQAPVLIVFNGGPGSSNLTLPGGMDSLTRVFHVLLPGYRGTDDSQYITKSLAAKNENSLNSEFQLIANDVSTIVNTLGCDTVYVTAHSFGSVFACWYLLKRDNHTTRAVFVSPILTKNITEVILAMEKMVEGYFQAFPDGNYFFSKLIFDIENSSEPEKASMGLILFLSEYHNFRKIIDHIKAEKNTVPLLQEAFQLHQKSINRNDWAAKLSSYFDITDTNRIAQINTLGRYLHTYFKSVIQPFNHDFVNFNQCRPELTIHAEFDFATAGEHQTATGLGHSDVWQVTWKYILELQRQPMRVEDSLIKSTEEQ